MSRQNKNYHIPTDDSYLQGLGVKDVAKWNLCNFNSRRGYASPIMILDILCNWPGSRIFAKTHAEDCWSMNSWRMKLRSPMLNLFVHTFLLYLSESSNGRVYPCMCLLTVCYLASQMESSDENQKCEVGAWQLQGHLQQPQGHLRSVRCYKGGEACCSAMAGDARRNRRHPAKEAERGHWGKGWLQACCLFHPMGT